MDGPFWQERQERFSVHAAKNAFRKTKNENDCLFICTIRCVLSIFFLLFYVFQYVFGLVRKTEMEYTYQVYCVLVKEDNITNRKENRDKHVKKWSGADKVFADSRPVCFYNRAGLFLAIQYSSGQCYNNTTSFYWNEKCCWSERMI